MVCLTVRVCAVCRHTTVYTCKTPVASCLAAVDFLLIFMYKKVRKKITFKKTKIMKLTKTQMAKDLFFNENLTTSIIAQKLNVSQAWVCRVINS